MNKNLTNKEKLKLFSFIFDGNNPICYTPEQIGTTTTNMDSDFIELKEPKFGYKDFYICGGWFYPIILKENPNQRETVHIGRISNNFSTGDSVRIDEKNM
jgi:hypothetical protein